MKDDAFDKGLRLQEARIAAGFRSARAAAIRHHWKPPTYAQHENGQRGFGRVVERYAEAFDVSAGWLLTGEGAGPKSRHTVQPQVDELIRIYRKLGPSRRQRLMEGALEQEALDAIERARATEAAGDDED